MADDLNAPIVPTPTPTPTAPDPAEHWTNEITDVELRGHLANKGWDKLSQSEALLEMAKAQRNAETLMRAPADQLVRIPREDDAEAQKAFWLKFGAKEKPDDYAVDVKFGADPDVSKEFTDLLRGVAADTHMPAPMLTKIAQELAKFSEKRDAARQEAATINMQTAVHELTEQWGPEAGIRYRTNLMIANNAADAVGLTQEQYNQIGEVIGPAAVAKAFHQIGVSMGEDKHILGTAGGQDAPISTVAQAEAKLAGLKRDEQWVKKFHKNDPDTMKQFKGLTRIIAGV